MAYKDTMFRSLFNNEKSLLELYNALHDTSLSERDTEIIINTLDETLVSRRRNDISFTLNGKLVVMLEHQSSINENMPFRFLQSISRIFENGIPDKKAVYRTKLIKFPRPEFIALINAPGRFPDRKTLRLSDSFMDTPGFEEVRLELEVMVYNINEGQNPEILARSAMLKEYAYFVARARRHIEAEKRRLGTTSEAKVIRAAIRNAVRDCKAKGYLLDYWEKMTEEDMSVFDIEWDHDTALEVRWEEGWEDGREEGREEGIEEGIEKRDRQLLAL
ncbi:MAG: hypothetical protein FWB78_07040, partial [Treponema sp.]|nr:hypothetical protein [Treponema sp.]